MFSNVKLKIINQTSTQKSNKLTTRLINKYDDKDDDAGKLANISRTIEIKLNYSIEMLNNTCKSPWIKFETLCLFTLNTSLTFEKAHEACQRMNSSMIFIYNENEWKFIISIHF